MTLPMTTDLISSGFNLLCCSAAWEATIPKSVADLFFSFPPNVPKAVLLAATMYTPLTAEKSKIMLNKMKNIIYI